MRLFLIVISMSISLDLKEFCIAMSTPPQPSGRSHLKVLKWGILVERDERSHVSERMAMEYFWLASKYYKDRRRAARLLTFHCNILKL